MTPALLRLAEAAVNRALALDPERERVLSPLEGRRIGVVLEGPVRFAFQVRVERGAVRLLADAGGAADVEVSGTPPALLSLLARPEALPAAAGVAVRGDAGLLAEARRAAMRLEPDWDEPVARVLGDELGYPVARGLRQAADLFARTLRELGADAREYLREESGLLAAHEEVEVFAAGVDALRDRVERLDKRVTHLERATARRS